MGPLLTIISYLIKRHEGGLVYHLKMPKTILSEKLTPYDYFLLFVQTAWNETIKCKNAFRKKLKLDVGPLLRIFLYVFKQLEPGLDCHFVLKMAIIVL